MPTVDLLAIFAHRDDAELLCGGTLAKAVAQGHRVGILDLTAGEMGTRGSADLRAREAHAAAQVLGVPMRENLGLPDAAVVNTPETRTLLARALRRLQPTVVVTHAPRGRHPDHRVTAQLVRDAAFVAGLARVAPGLPPHRPRKILHAIAFREDHVKPTFVVDVSAHFERKLDAVRCYASQFEGATHSGEAYPTGEPLLDLLRHQAAHYGSLIRVRYGEPFWTQETLAVEDVATLAVSTL